MSVTAVITTACNRGPWMRRALDSVLAQARPVDRVIVSNNGSTDDTRAIAEEYAAADPRIDYYEEPSIPMGEHWWKAAGRASTDWVKFVFDDDWLDAGCIGALLDLVDDDTYVAQCAARFDWTGQVAYDAPGDMALQDAVRCGRLSVSPVTALHRTDTLPRTYRLLRMLPPEAMQHGVGPIVLMNYGLVVREPWRHRHTPQALVWLGGDDLPGQARSTTSRLRDADPHTLSHGHALAYDALDVLAAI